MTRWAMVILVVAGGALGLPGAQDVRAGELRGTASLLLPGSPVLDAASLDAQNARGLAETAFSLEGQAKEFGVILWDELKPSRPNGPPSHPAQPGQGVSRISATAK